MNDNSRQRTCAEGARVALLAAAATCGALCAALAADVTPTAAGKPHFTPLKYNSEGTAYMKAGLCSSAVVGDFDGNGVPDLLLGAEDGFFYLLRNVR